MRKQRFWNYGPELRIDQIKTAGTLQDAYPHASDLSGLEILGEGLQQTSAVARPVASVLLELHYISADQPVANNEGLIDDSDSAAKQVPTCRVDRLYELAVFHVRSMSHQR